MKSPINTHTRRHPHINEYKNILVNTETHTNRPTVTYIESRIIINTFNYRLTCTHIDSHTKKQTGKYTMTSHEETSTVFRRSRDLGTHAILAPQVRNSFDLNH